MKKMLAVVRRTEDGFHGYVPKLPGCEIRATTAEQAEADISAAAHAHIAEGKEGTNGFAPDQVEIAVVVEPLLPEHLRADDADPVARWGWEFPSDEELDRFLNPDDYKWVAFEEMMTELGYDPEEPSVEGNGE